MSRYVGITVTPGGGGEGRGSNPNNRRWWVVRGADVLLMSTDSDTVTCLLVYPVMHSYPF